MLLLILLGIFTAFLSLAFALLHLMASLSELRTVSYTHLTLPTTSRV